MGQKLFINTPTALDSSSIRNSYIRKKWKKLVWWTITTGYTFILSRMGYIYRASLGNEKTERDRNIYWPANQVSIIIDIIWFSLLSKFYIWVIRHPPHFSPTPGVYFGFTWTFSALDTGKTKTSLLGTLMKNLLPVEFFSCRLYLTKADSFLSWNVLSKHTEKRFDFPNKVAYANGSSPNIDNLKEVQINFKNALWHIQ